LLINYLIKSDVEVLSQPLLLFDFVF